MKIGKFKVIKKLGAGGKGEVFLVTHPIYKKKVALKLQSSTSSLTTLKREYLIAKYLHHPNIVQVYEFDKLENGRGYYTMEFIEGVPFSWDKKELSTLITLIVQLSKTLAYIHNQGIVHLDLKPQNVWILKGGKIKIGDFGLAQREGKWEEFKGTIEYMAPEVIIGEGVDRRADIYSFGIMLYEAITGVVPFTSPDLIEILKNHLQTPPPLPLKGNVPHRISNLILKMLAKEPENRFQRVEEILKELGETEEMEEVEEKNLLLRSKFVGRREELEKIKKIIKTTKKGNKIIGVVGRKGIGKSRFLEECRKIAIQEKKEVKLVDDFHLKKEKTLPINTQITIISVEEETVLPYLVDEIIYLTPLTKLHTKQMISSILYFQPIPQKFVERVYKLTGGVPLYIIQVLHSLTGEVVKFKKGKWVIEEEKLSHHTEKLKEKLTFPKEEEELLKLLSIFPNSISLEEIKVVTGGEEFYSTLERLCKMGVITLTSSGYKFAGELERGYFYQKLTPIQKIKLHKRVALFLEKKGEKIEDCAYHFLKAKIKEKALSYYLKAIKITKNKLKIYQNILPLTTGENRRKILEEMGDILYQQEKYQEAKENFEKLLKSYPLTGDEKFSLYLKIGDCYEKLDKITEAIKMYQLAMKKGKTSSLCRRIGWAYFRKGEISKSLTFTNEGIVLARKEKMKKEESNLFHTLGSIYLHQGDYSTSISNFTYALRIEKNTSNLIGMAGTYTNLAIAYFKMNKYEESIKKYHQALSLYKNLNLLKGEARVYQNIGLTYYLLNNPQKAEEYYNKAIRIYTYLNLPLQVTSLYHSLSLLLLENHHPEETIEKLEKIIKIKEKMKDEKNLDQIYNNMGLAYLFNSNYFQAESCFKKSLKLKEKKENKTTLPSPMLNLSLLYLQWNKPKEAETYLLKLKKIINSPLYLQYLPEFHLYMGELNLLKENKEGALFNFTTSVDKARQMKNKEIEGRGCRNLGKIKEEEKLIQRSVEIFKTIQNKRELTLSMLELAKLQIKKKNISSAEKNLQKTIELGRMLGMKKVVEEGEKLLTQLRYRELNTLHKIIEIIDLTPNLNKLLPKIMNIAIEVVGAEKGILFLYQNGKYEPKVVKGVEEEVTKIVSSISKSVIKKVKETGKPVISMNTLEDESYQLKKSIQLHQIKSIFCFPLLLDSEVIGILYLDTRKVPLFIQDKDLLFLQSFVHLLSLSIKNAKSYQLLEEENVYLHQTSSSSFSSTLIGNSPSIKQLYTLITTISKTDAPVLIEGETGVGKELVAREIHKLSKRRNNKFIPIDCPSIPRDLFEAELFGYKKGAFTGATQDKKGLIEEGDEGTVFFDEIGELPITLQPKLLRVLQQGEIRRVGDTGVRKVNIRIICATNRNLQEEIKKSTFREDLYYRINVVKIFIPPLRERKEDIPVLAHHFLQLYSKKFNIPVKGITPQTMDLLLSYSWPGNVRELENKIAQSILLAPPNSYITPSLLSLPIHQKPSLPLLAETEKNLILQTLRLYNFNKTKTAQALGISRIGLLKKLKKYQIVNNVNNGAKIAKKPKNK